MGIERVVFRTDSVSSIGMGHLYRTLALAVGFEARGYEVCFAMRLASGAALELLDGHDLFMIPEHASWDDEVAVLSEKFGKNGGCLVWDISHTETFSRVEGFSRYSKELANVFAQRVLIDGFDENALVEQIPLSADIVIVPYVGAEQRELKSHDFIHLAGPGYMVFDSAYANVPAKRNVVECAKRILITMGGSDPVQASLIALAACCELEESAEVRVIVGRGFDQELVACLEEQSATLDWCELVYSPSSLVDEMLWADIAISASGLTKYELALCGTPAILLSFNEEHACINRIFDTAGTSVDVGVFSEITIFSLATEVSGLLGDYVKRKRLVRAGQALVDISGTDRIISAVQALCEE